jgi:ribose transport system substrate-binding protein
VIQNPDVQTYAKLIKKAEDEGIYVIQVNMRSAQSSTAFVGLDSVEVGERMTHAVSAIRPPIGMRPRRRR